MHQGGFRKAGHIQRHVVLFLSMGGVVRVHGCGVMF